MHSAEPKRRPDHRRGAGRYVFRRPPGPIEQPGRTPHRIRSMRDHANIPSTFDDEIPEFAFGEGEPRLLIGRHYLVKGEDGAERPGLLTTATVVEAERKAYCGVSFNDGTSAICAWDLSEVEMAAWLRHPDTFFGQVGQRKTKAETPLELYDFLLSGYSKTPKELMLEFMSGASDIDELYNLDQPTLASIYAERCTNSVLAMQPAPDGLC